MRHFPGEYPADWKELNAIACEAAGHRCVRCHHPYRKGTHGKGEWTRCDDLCSHGEPVRLCANPDDGWEAQWRILTVHHLTGDKSCRSWWCHLPLCQRCHLEIQGKLDPDMPYFLEHSNWIKPYIAGYYAHKYLHEELTREQVMLRLDELLALERKI